MTTERTRRAHDLAKIKAHLKHIAEDTREIRVEARKLTGMDRWHKQREANENALTARCMGLAYGYLRGKSISQMESPFSDPDGIPHHGMVTMFAHAVFEAGPEGLRSEDTPPKEKSAWDKLVELGYRAFRSGSRPEPNKTDKVIPGWAEFQEHVDRDIAAWKTQLAARRAARAAEKRNVA